jgi:hypothetical protein
VICWPRMADLQGRIPARPSYGEGSFHRCIRLERAPGAVRGELQDDFHHFAVTLRHDAGRVTEAAGEAHRFPWTTCPGAVDPLRSLSGMPLTRSLLAIARYTDPRAQCTHLFDVASLAVTLAARPRDSLFYEIQVPDRRGGATTATLLRDGEPLLCWRIEGAEVVEPAPFAGRRLHGGGFADWAESALDPEGAEAALVLRRAVVIAMGRGYDMDRVPEAKSFASATGIGCYTFHPARVGEARRIVGSTRDWSDAPEKLRRA